MPDDRPYDPDNPTNSDRAHWAQLAVDAFRDATRSDAEVAVQDLLTDLMHLVGVDAFYEMAAMARTHYDAELEEDEQGDIVIDEGGRAVNGVVTFGTVRIDGIDYNVGDEIPNDDEEDDTCGDCGRDMAAGEPHTAECETALQQDEEDGTR